MQNQHTQKSSSPTMQELLEARKRPAKTLKGTAEQKQTKPQNTEYVTLEELSETLALSHEETADLTSEVYPGNAPIPRKDLPALIEIATDILSAKYRQDHRKDKAMTLRDIQNQTVEDLLQSQADQGAMLGALASQIRDNAMLNELLAGQQNSNALVHALSQLNYETMQSLAEQLGNGCNPEAIKKTVGDRGQARQTRSDILNNQTQIDWAKTLKK